MSKKLLTFEYEFDFFLIGISCHEKDYRLCWNINQTLQIDLVKIESLEIYNAKEKTRNYFSLFAYEDEENQRTVYLISNRGNQGLLISEQKKTDFFLLIKGALLHTDKENFLQELKKISLILTSFEIDPGKLKSRKNLIF